MILNTFLIRIIVAIKLVVWIESTPNYKKNDKNINKDNVRNYVGHI